MIKVKETNLKRMAKFIDQFIIDARFLPYVHNDGSIELRVDTNPLYHYLIDGGKKLLGIDVIGLIPLIAKASVDVSYEEKQINVISLEDILNTISDYIDGQNRDI